MLNKNFMVMKQQSGISTTYVLEFQSNWNGNVIREHAIR